MTAPSAARPGGGRTRLAVLGPLLALSFVVLAIVGPFLSPIPPDRIDLAHELAAPGGAHVLGTAENGVDILAILLAGARLSGTIALLAVGLSVSIGVLFGLWAGTRGGVVESAASALADLVQCFPSIVLHIAILAIVARPGVLHVSLALAATGWVIHFRIARAQALSLKGRDFVEAARALGAPEWRVLLRHVLPNALGPIVVQATAALGGAVLAESTLSFLGLGPGGMASWGALLDQGASLLLRFPHVAMTSGSAIALTVLGFHLSGDWLAERVARR